jgi:HAD superfamily hydrolase (TIGR01549 family)
MKKIKAVIFDIDGTLGNTLPLCIQAFRQTVEPLVHHPLTDEEIEATFGPNEAGTIKRLAPNSDYNKAAEDFLHHYEVLHHMCPQPFDGIIDLLTALKSKGVHLAVASGKGEESSKMTLERFGIATFFAVVKNGSLDGKQKPGDIEQLVQSFGNVTKEQTVYIGDSPSDIEDSRKAGVIAAAAAWAPTAKRDKLEKEQPNELFDKVSKFRDWLNSNT